MNIKAAQEELCSSYANGAIGVAVSGVVWLASGIAALSLDTRLAMAVLFFGGMAIHPLSTLIVRQIMKRPAVSAENSLEMIGLLTVPIILLGLFAGYLVSGDKPAWFFAIALMAVGARYLTFKTIYGLSHYIFLGFALLAIGFAGIWLAFPSGDLIAIAAGTTELIAAAVLWSARPKAAV